MADPKQKLSGLTVETTIAPTDRVVFVKDPAGVPAARTIEAKNAFREKLAAGRTYFVSPTGSDANDGLSAGTAFLTLQKAWDTVAALDLSIFKATIQVSAGTYAKGIVMSSSPVGGSGVDIIGDETTPANVFINETSDCFRNTVPLGAPVEIRGFKLATSGAGNGGVVMDAAGTISAGSIEAAGGSTTFKGWFTAQAPGSKIIMLGSGAGHTITGSMSAYLQTDFGGVIQFFGQTVTLTGTPNFSWVFARALGVSFMAINSTGVTFSGAGTGQRYSVDLNSVIDTRAGGATFLPGDVAGTVATGGQYV